MLPLRDHLATRSVAGVTRALIGLNVATFAFEVVTAAGAGAAVRQAS